MLEKIIDWSIANKFMVILGAGFVSLMGLAAVQSMPLDAIPDLSDVQVIVFTEYPGQSPQVVEDQITYPITTQMLAVPFAKVVRGVLVFRILVRLHHLRRRNRHVLGEEPRARVHELCERIPSARS